MGDHSDAAIRRMLERSAKTASKPCGADDLVAAYLEGVLENEERRRFEEHASSCPNCLRVLGMAMKLAPAPDDAEAEPAEMLAPDRKTLFRISIPIAAVAAAAVLVIAGAVVLNRIRDAGGGQERISEVRTIPGIERERSLPAGPSPAGAASSGAASASPGAALTGMRDRSPAVRDSTPTLGAAAPAQPAAPARREPPEVALSSAPTAETSAEDAMVIRALLARTPGRGPAAAPTAGQAAQRMLLEQADTGARSDFHTSGKIAIKGRTFQGRGAYWVDDECLAIPGAEIVEIRPDTKEYQEIMASYPEIRGLLAAGKSVVLCLDGRICVLR